MVLGIGCYPLGALILIDELKSSRQVIFIYKLELGGARMSQEDFFEF